ncbi:hypothetical protein [Romboutsia sp.]|uniref:hypothetical protein n=1 Tax=Romboutsia sp. TaxID=1965302 RepID=UPI003F3FDCD8
MNKNIVYKALVKEIIRDNNEGIKKVILENLDGNKFILPGSEIEGKMHWTLREKQLVDFVHINESIVSSKKAMPIRRNIIISQLKSEEGTSGIVKKIHSWGATLSIKGVICAIDNSDFSEDHTTVGCVYNVGDEIKGLILNKITGNQVIIVKFKEKYKSNLELNQNFLKEGNLIYGVVKNIKKFENTGTMGCFIGIPGDRDMLTRLPAFDVIEGDRVVCKIKKVNMKKEQIKGKIIKIIA